jgi:hypothetical protein
MRYLLIFIFSIFTCLASAQPRVNNSNTTTFNQHIFSWSAPIIDSLQIIDPLTGNESWYVKSRMPIIKMDKNEVLQGDIYNISNLKHEGYKHPQLEYIIENITLALKKNSNRLIQPKITAFQIKNLVINTNGEIVYYDVVTQSKDDNLIGDNKLKELNDQIHQILNTPYLVNPNGGTLDNIYYIEKLPTEFKID